MFKFPDDFVVEGCERPKIRGIEVVYRLQRGIRVAPCVCHSFRVVWYRSTARLTPFCWRGDLYHGVVLAMFGSASRTFLE